MSKGRKAYRIDRIATGKRIRKAMEQKNISIQEMASELGVSYQAVQGYIKGTRMPNVQHFYMITKILEIPSNKLAVLKKISGTNKTVV